MPAIVAIVPPPEPLLGLVPRLAAATAPPAPSQSLIDFEYLG